MTEPGLGSGALREALLGVREKHGDGTQCWCMRIWQNQRGRHTPWCEAAQKAVDDSSALSLSSPIEPCEHDKTDLGHVHTIAEEASSEVRELREALEEIRRTPKMPFPDAGAHSWRAYADALSRAYNRIQTIATDALAPSRQGAGGK